MTGLPKATCPSCLFTAGLEAFIGTDDARGVLKIMSECPGTELLRKALLRYVALFSPASRMLSWSRAEKLMGEVVAMMAAARIERNGRTWPAPLDYWQQALDEILGNANLRRPLKSHGYLLEIIAGLADKAEARAETGRHARGGGSTPIATSNAHKDFPQQESRPPHNRQAASAAMEEAKTILKGAKQ